MGPAACLPEQRRCRPPCGRRRGAGVGFFGTLAVGALILAAAGCAAPTALSAGAAAGPAGPPQLVCYADSGELVVAAAQGQNRVALRVQPPQELSVLAVAADTLVGAGHGKLWALLGTGAERHWQQIARWDPEQWNPEPLRAASYGKSAVVWMRGRAPATVPAALEVTAQGQVIKEAVAVAELSLGGIWQSSHAPAGAYDVSFPEPLRLLVREVRMIGPLAREELLHSERSPWGGRLTAPELALPLRGDWPDAPLFYVGNARDSVPVPLEYRGEPLLHRGLIGYGAAAQLYFDGRFSAGRAGLLVVAAPGSSGQSGSRRLDRALKAQPVPGLRPPCAVISPDWRD